MKNELLAPNGKSSNLNATQYELVRTSAFKNWFGDWENDPVNASKVVDENGEPLVCFHGSNREFNVFRSDVGRANDMGFYGRGFYFTFNTDGKWIKFAKSEAGYYGSIVKDYFIKSINPFDFSSLSIYKGVEINFMGTETIVFLSNVAQMFPHLSELIKIPKKVWNKEAQEYESTFVPISVLPELIEKYSKLLKTYKTTNNYGEEVVIGYVKSEIVEYDYTKSGGKKGSYESREDLLQVDDKYSESEKEILLIVEAIEKYDGISYDYYPEGYMTRFPEITDAIKINHDSIVQSKFGDEIVVFEPNQIKLADGTNTTFDLENNDIRYEKGGQAKGDCYVVSGKIVIRGIVDKNIKFKGTPYLVHAVVQHSKIKGLEFSHAFIEDDENVYDYLNGREIVMQKEIYYFFGKIDTKDKDRYRKYTFREAKEKMYSTGNYGCWDIKGKYVDGGKLNEDSNTDKAKAVAKKELEKIKFLECDGATRVLHYVFDKEKIKHVVKKGIVTFDGEEIPLHFWIELPDGNIVDYKSRMWLGNQAQEGVFKPNSKTKYIGEPIDLKMSETVYRILTMESGGALSSTPSYLKMFLGK
jgi:hypothetical protein